MILINFVVLLREIGGRVLKRDYGTGGGGCTLVSHRITRGALPGSLLLQLKKVKIVRRMKMYE